LVNCRYGSNVAAAIHLAAAAPRAMASMASICANKKSSAVFPCWKMVAASVKSSPVFISPEASIFPESYFPHFHALVVLLLSESRPVRTMRIILVFYVYLMNRLRCLRWLLDIKSAGLGNKRDTAKGERCKASHESKLHHESSELY
jgi:hypothetical protein